MDEQHKAEILAMRDEITEFMLTKHSVDGQFDIGTALPALCLIICGLTKAVPVEDRPEIEKMVFAELTFQFNSNDITS